MKRTLSVICIILIVAASAFAGTYAGAKVTYGLLGGTFGTDFDSFAGVEGSVSLPIPAYVISLFNPDTKAEDRNPVNMLTIPAVQAKAYFKVVDTKGFGLNIGGLFTGFGLIDFEKKGITAVMFAGPSVDMDIRFGETVSLNLCGSYPFALGSFSTLPDGTNEENSSRAWGVFGTALIGILNHIFQVGLNFQL